MAFKEVDQKKSIDEREKEILAFWESEKIFEKSVQRRDADDAFTFYDGPPFATGLPHYGHMVGSTMKDVVPRYWTMRGKRVERVWGWDCHGLPIENIVEKELGTTSKKDILDMGVDVFNEKCRTKVLEYAGEWEGIVPRLGRWVDMKNAYRTMDRDYMESVWWVFKTIYDKGLVYEDYRSMHICPRCETTLSQSEVTEGYKDIKDLSVTAKFELVDEPGTFVLAWTTTPWTLPGNVALAVSKDKDIEYLVMELETSDVEGLDLTPGEKIILANDTSVFINVFGEPIHYGPLPHEGDLSWANVDFHGKGNLLFKNIKILRGSEIVGLSYKPLYDAYAKDGNLANTENGWKVYAADFVTTEDGTGVVHIAPAFGTDDMALGKEHNLPWVQHVGMDGVMKDAVADFAGLHVKPIEDHQVTDIEIIKNLAHKGLLFHKEKYEHSYPHCWRCDTPLLNYATGSWFVSVEKIKDQLLDNAKNINWSPEHIKEGRFGKWLEGARDWSISRQRFWASVIPIWVCEGCDEKIVFGSAQELEEKSGQKVLDLHKHVVDGVTFDCVSCEGTMRRVPDVLDTWFDSGSMPYAQKHYPFENKEKFENGYPADFIAEGVDMTRAWFYYLHVLGGATLEKNVFQNVIVNGTVVAEDGKKMSKKLQNYPDPMKIVEKYGADALRFYLMSSPVVAAENLSFNEKDLQEVSRGLFRMLHQSYSFFVMYANVDGWTPDGGELKSKNVLDRWIHSRLEQLTTEVNDSMEAYELHKAARAFVPFVDDLSNWYIRRSRKRFWKSEDDDDKNNAYTTLHHVLVELVKMMAPFTPFQSDEMYKNLTGRESVHLEDFPIADQNEANMDLLVQMADVRDVISKGLELRASNKCKVRQPLGDLHINASGNNSPFFGIPENVLAQLKDMLMEELNVKHVYDHISQNDFTEAIDGTTIVLSADKIMALDIEITPELKLEGQAREVIRVVQQGRKKAGFNVDDRISLSYEGLEEVFEKHAHLIAHEILATEVVNEKSEHADYTDTINIDGDSFTFGVTKYIDNV